MRFNDEIDIFKTVYGIVNLDQIEAKFTSGEVSRVTLIEAGLLSGINKRLPIKILGNGELKSSLTFVNIDKFSKTATQLIEKSGSKIETK